MKIKMLKTICDGDLLIWEEGDTFVVDNDIESDMFVLKTIGDQPYGVSKDTIWNQYEILEESNEFGNSN